MLPDSFASAHRPDRRGLCGVAFTIFAVMAVAVLPAGCGRPPPPAGFVTVATLAPAVVDESSGLAASHRAEGMLWTHNDSGGQPVLYAIGLDGKLRGSVRLAGVKNVDWEDIASFELDGRAWLLVADTGDNAGPRSPYRKNCALQVIAEPDPADLSPDHETAVSVSWSIPVSYADGPHDCESVAVDVREGNVYLLRKRTFPNLLMTLPLRPVAGGATPPAREICLVKNIPQPSSSQRAFPIPSGRYRGNPTGMDISSDGLTAAVLTYGDVLIYSRRPGENWSRAFSRAPVVMAPHGLSQAEGICFSRDGRSVFVDEETTHSPLLRYDLTPSKTP